MTSSHNAAAWRAEFRATLALAWPLVLTNVTQMLINFTDVVLLGRVGPDALAASAIGSGIVIAMMLFGIGLVTAASPLIASEIGRKAHAVREVRRTVQQAFWAATAMTLPMLALLWFTGDLMRLAGQPARLAADTGLFVRALQWQLLPALGTVILRTFIAALGRPGWSLVVGIGGVVANALINATLIFGLFGIPALGLLGAGIGTSIVSTLMFLAMVLVVTQHRRFRRYHLFGHFFRPDWARFRDIWRIGTPISLQLGFEASVFGAAVFLMGYFGTASAAAHAVAIQIASMTFMVPMGIAQAATVRVGYGHGRGDTMAIGRAGWSAFILGVGFMGVMAVLMWSFPRTLAQLFLDPDMKGNAEVIRLAVSFLMVAALFQIVDGAQVVGAGMLRGLHDTRWPMLFALFGYWVIGIGIGAGLGFWGGMQGLGIWIGLASGLGVVSTLMLWRWTHRERYLGASPA